MLFTVFLFILLLSVVLVSISLFTIYKLGDERDDKIKDKASRYTLTIFMAYLVINIVSNWISIKNGNEIGKSNPFIDLVILSVLFLINVVKFRRKYS